jgi:transcriptional regulator with XRE-family HTH domain
MPTVVPGREVTVLLINAQRALNLSQRQLAESLGLSVRTMGRWQAGRTSPHLDLLKKLAAMVHPHDAALASALAVEAGTTLEALGLVARRAEAPQAPPARAFPPVALIVDSVVHAATEAQRTEAPMREVLRAAFERARGIGLSIDEVCAALQPAKKAPPRRDA